MENSAGLHMYISIYYSNIKKSKSQYNYCDLLKNRLKTYYSTLISFKTSFVALTAAALFSNNAVSSALSL